MSETKVEKIIGLIPARWASTRFPGKPLHIIAGKPLIQHVWERVSRCKTLDAVAIATDDERIEKAAKAFGARVIMTRSDHPSGSDRLAEAVTHFRHAEIILNVQGDEPLIDPRLVDQLAKALVENNAIAMATAACPILDEEDFLNHNVVKVVCNLEHEALYFSRSPIPFPRSPLKSPALRHLGIYAYRRDFLENYVRWEPTELEQTESLEQLRALEHGARIRIIHTEHQGLGVDTPEQVARIESILLQLQ